MWTDFCESGNIGHFTSTCFHKLSNLVCTFVLPKAIELLVIYSDISVLAETYSELINKQIKILAKNSPPSGVLRKKCSKNVQKIYSRTHMWKCDFNKVAATLLKSHFGMGGSSSVNLLHIAWRLFHKSTSQRLLLDRR